MAPCVYGFHQILTATSLLIYDFGSVANYHWRGMEGCNMQVTLNKNGTILLIELEGRLDTSTPPEFETQLLDLIESGETHLVFDLSRVEQVSASGLRVLIRAFKQVI